MEQQGSRLELYGAPTPPTLEGSYILDVFIEPIWYVHPVVQGAVDKLLNKSSNIYLCIEL